MPGIELLRIGAEAVADAALDVRLMQGFKAFADLEWSYNPALSQSRILAAIIRQDDALIMVLDAQQLFFEKLENVNESQI